MSGGTPCEHDKIRRDVENVVKVCGAPKKGKTFGETPGWQQRRGERIVKKTELNSILSNGSRFLLRIVGVQSRSKTYGSQMDDHAAGNEDEKATGEDF